MSIFLTTFTFSLIWKPRGRSTDLKSRPPPLTISLTCAAGSPAPQAEKISLSVRLWVKLQATNLIFRMAFNASAYLIKGLTGLVSASLRHFLTALHSSSTKIFIFRTCSSHSTLIWCLGTHIAQLVSAWWLLGRFPGHLPSSRLAEPTLGTLLCSWIRIKRIRYYYKIAFLHPRTLIAPDSFYYELVIKWEIE